MEDNGKMMLLLIIFFFLMYFFVIRDQKNDDNIQNKKQKKKIKHNIKTMEYNPGHSSLNATIKIDYDSKIVFVEQEYCAVSDSIPFEKIVDCSTRIERNKKSGLEGALEGGLVGALVGGVVAGGIGAIIGSQASSKSYISQMYLTIHTNENSHDKHTIMLVDADSALSESEYGRARDFASKITQIMRDIAAENGHKQSIENQSETEDKSTDIRPTKKKCSYCDMDSPYDAFTCSHCGASDFIEYCSNCGTLVASGQYCTRCGKHI